MSKFLPLNLVVHKATTKLRCTIRVPDRVAKKFWTTNHSSLLLNSALTFTLACPTLAVLQYIVTRSNSYRQTVSPSFGQLPLPNRVCVCVCVCVCVLRARFHASFLLSSSPSLCTKERDASSQLLVPCKGCWQRRSLHLELPQPSKQLNFKRVRKTTTFVMSVYTSVCPHGTSRLPKEGFSWKYRVAREKTARRLVDQRGRRSRTLYRKLNKCKCKVLTG